MAYANKANFNEFCVFMSVFKKAGIAYDELCAALRRSEKAAEDVIELSILAKDNKCTDIGFQKVHMTIFAKSALCFFHILV